jgi:hypothetical protein
MIGPKTHIRNLRISEDAGQIPINSASLQLDDTDKGLLVNRVSSSEELLISNPQEGLLVYNTDTSMFDYYTGTLWMPVASGISRFGDFFATAATLQTINVNQDITLSPNGTGSTNVLGGISICPTSSPSTPVFSIDNNGKIKAYITNLNSTDSAFQLIGNSAGNYVSPENPGVSLQMTGQTGIPSRVYNDGVNNYAAFIGRRYNGTPSAPSGVLTNDIMSRIGATGYLAEGAWPTISNARINFVASENQTLTAQGNRIEFWTTPIGSIVPVKQFCISSVGINTCGDIIPTYTNTQSLGSSTNVWKDIYVGPDSLYLTDATLGTHPKLIIDNGDVKFETTTSFTVGGLTLTQTGITAVSTTADFSCGNLGDTGKILINRTIKFPDNTLQSTAGIATNLLGQQNGVATLDSGGKLTTAQIPTSLTGATIYKGTWDASTNTPTLVNGTGTAGWEYAVSVGGTVDFGAGDITFNAGDFVIYDSSIWSLIPTSIGVSSFNTRSGVVTLTSSDVTTALTSASITNAKLVNSSVTITSGAGLSGGGSLSLGGSLTLVNTGLLSVTDGSGISSSTLDGVVTIDNTGVLSLTAGTYLHVDTGTGDITITTNATNSNTASTLVARDASGNFSAGTITANLTGTASVADNMAGGVANQISYQLSPSTSSFIAAPTVTNTFLKWTGSAFAWDSAIISVSGTANQITASTVSGETTLSLPAAITLPGSLTLAAGTTTLSPLKFVSGTNLTSATAGVMEFDGTSFYATPVNLQRGIVPSEQFFCLNTSRSYAGGTGTQLSLLGVGVTLTSSTRYHFSIKARVSKTVNTNQTLSLAFAGTATPSTISYYYSTNGNSGILVNSQVITTAFATGVTITQNTNAAVPYTLEIFGIIDIAAGGGGTLIPTIGFSGSPGTITVQTHTMMRVFPIGVIGSNTSIGTWA